MAFKKKEKKLKDAELIVSESQTGASLIKSFRGTKILASEAKILKEIEKKLRKKFRTVDDIDNYTEMGFTVENNRVIKMSLYNCELKALPEVITNLSSLKILNLNTNQLEKLPKSISKLSSLIELNLYVNELTELPESLGELKSLQALILTYNELREIPESI